MRRLGLGGARQRRAVHRDGLAVEHGQTGFLFLELRFDLGLKGIELAQEPQHGSLDFHVRGPRPARQSPPGLRFRLSPSMTFLDVCAGVRLAHHASSCLRLAEALRERPRQVRLRVASASHPRLGQHREGDQRHLPELDLVQQPLPARGLLAPERAVADRQPVDRARLQQHMRLARRLHLEQQPPLDPEPAPVLAHLVPDPDRPRRVVLPEHLHPRPRLGEPRQRRAVGALLHHVAALVGGAEQARVPGDLRALLQRQLAVEAAELRLRASRTRQSDASSHLPSGNRDRAAARRRCRRGSATPRHRPRARSAAPAGRAPPRSGSAAARAAASAPPGCARSPRSAPTPRRRAHRESASRRPGLRVPRITPPAASAARAAAASRRRSGTPPRRPAATAPRAPRRAPARCRSRPSAWNAAP